MTATEHLIANYGLWAVFLGGILEGETVLILAAVAAHHGLLPLPMVFLVGTISATLGNQTWFMLARHRSQMAPIQAMLQGPRVQRALDLVQRHPTTFILSFRFIYGLRIAGAVACGLSNITAVRFAVLNVLAALIWTILILALGYGFGSAIEVILGEARRIEWKILATLAGLSLLFAVGRLVQRHRKR
jgi:membrane protein DedA with SNARE-associated domain